MCTENFIVRHPPRLPARENDNKWWIKWDNNAYQLTSLIMGAKFILEIVFKADDLTWHAQLCLFRYFEQLSSKKHRCEFLFCCCCYKADCKGFWKLGFLNKVFQVLCNHFEYKINSFPAVRHYVECNLILIVHCMACSWVFICKQFPLLKVGI